jgi:hypothetical protein
MSGIAIGIGLGINYQGYVQPASGANPFPDIAAAWKLEANGNDSVGTKHLSLSSATNVTHSAGKSGNGFMLTATVQPRYSIPVADDGFLDCGNDAFTISIWAKFDPSLLADPAATASPCLAANGTAPAGSQNYGWAFLREYHAGNYARLIVRTAPDTVAAPTIFTVNDLNYGDAQWHHYALSRAAGTDSRLRIYYDGVKVLEGSSPGVQTIAALSNAVWHIGAHSFNSFTSTTRRSFLPGIDEVYYWQRELLEEEVSYLCNSGTGNFYSP